MDDFPTGMVIGTSSALAMAHLRKQQEFCEPLAELAES